MLTTEEPVKRCKSCKAWIKLAPFGLHFKWINGRGSWHCGSDPAYPTRAHAPEES